MAYHPGASNSWKSNKTENGSNQWNAGIPIDVMPLNSIPPPTRAPASTTRRFNPTPFGGLPAMVFLTSQPTDHEWNNIVGSISNGVALTGSAALGKVGPAIGSVDIAESVDEYFFRVALPGVVKDEKSFTCNVSPDGEISVKGMKSTGEETVCKKSIVFTMQACDAFALPGDFSVAFQLPGPVLNQEVITAYGSGIFEGLVKKRLQAEG